MLGSPLRMLAVVLCATLIHLSASPLGAQTLTIDTPAQDEVLTHGMAFPEISGSYSDPGPNVYVKIKVTNIYVKNGVQHTNIANTVVQAGPGTGMFHWTPSMFPVGGFGGNATWKVEVELVTDGDIKDAHDGTVTPPGA